MPAFKSDPFFIIEVGGQIINSAEDPRVIDFEFTESDESGKALTFTLEDHELRLMDDPRFVEGKKVTWKYGYTTNLSPLYVGKIGEVECSFDADSGTTIKVHVFDAVLETLSGKRSKEWKAPTAKGWRFSEVVEKIAALHNLKPDVEPTKFLVPKFQQSNESDWDFIQRHRKTERAQDASKDGIYRLFFSADNKTLFWKPTTLNGPAVKTYLRYLETINPEIISFRPRSKPHDPKAGGKDGTTNAEKGPNDEVEEEQADNDTEATRNQSEPGYLVGAVEGTEMGRTTGAVTTNPATENSGNLNDEAEVAKTPAANKLKEDEMKAIEGDLEVILEPNIRRGDTINLKGFGRKFSGKWLVTSVRATIGQGGAISEFGLLKTTVTDAEMAAKKAKGNPSGPPNPEKNQPPQPTTVSAASGAEQ